MSFSQFSKLFLILALSTFIACERQNNTTPTNTTPQSSTTTPEGPKTTTTTVKSNSSDVTMEIPSNNGLQKNIPKTKEESMRMKKELLANEATAKSLIVGPNSTLQPSNRPYIPAVGPDALPKDQRDNKQADTKDASRALIRYYNFLTDIRGLNLNLPKEMLGGASAFKAVDVLQFTLKDQPPDKPVAILVAEFNNTEEHSRGTDLMRKLGTDGRKAFQAKNYTLLIKNGDEKLQKILTDSLEQFR